MQLVLGLKKKAWQMNKWAWVDAPLAATSSSSQNAVGLTQLRFKLA